MITVKIVGDYNTGHHYERVVEVPGFGPDVDIEDWWEDTVFQETGDGQFGRHVDAIHTCTVVAADPPHENLVGATYDLDG